MSFWFDLNGKKRLSSLDLLTNRVFRKFLPVQQGVILFPLDSRDKINTKQRVVLLLNKTAT